MASKKNKNEVRFILKEDDFRAFGRYRIIYTKGGRKLVNMQRLTYFISGVVIAALFTVFHVDPTFTKFAYAVAAVIGIGGPLFAERIVLRQQDKEISSGQSSIDMIHPVENIITFGDESFTTKAGDDEQSFEYKDIKLIDLTEEAIYVWMSDTMIMPIPKHAFAGMPEMKETYKFLKTKNQEQGGAAGNE